MNQNSSTNSRDTFRRITFIIIRRYFCRGQEFLAKDFFGTFLCSLLSIFRFCVNFLSIVSRRYHNNYRDHHSIVSYIYIHIFFFSSMFSPSNNNNNVTTRYTDYITLRYHHHVPVNPVVHYKQIKSTFLLVDVHVGKLIDGLIYAALPIGLYCITTYVYIV